MGREEILKRPALGDRTSPQAFFHPRESRFNLRNIFFRSIVNACPVARSCVAALPVEAEGVDGAEKAREQEVQAHDGGIVADPDRLREARRIRIHFFIGRGVGVSVGKANLGFPHPVDEREKMLRSPVAAS